MIVIMVKREKGESKSRESYSQTPRSPQPRWSIPRCPVCFNASRIIFVVFLESSRSWKKYNKYVMVSAKKQSYEVLIMKDHLTTYILREKSRDNATPPLCIQLRLVSSNTKFMSLRLYRIRVHVQVSNLGIVLKVYRLRYFKACALYS